MAASYRGKTEGADGESTTYALKSPAALGDVVFFDLFVTTESAVTIPGLTVVQIKDGGSSFVVAYGFATSGEQTFTASWGGAKQFGSGSIVAYKEADATTPIAAKASELGLSSKTITWPSITPGVANCLDVLFALQGAGIKSGASGYTQRVSKFPDYIADKALVSGGSTGTVTAEMASAEGPVVFRFAVAPEVEEEPETPELPLTDSTTPTESLIKKAKKALSDSTTPTETFTKGASKALADSTTPTESWTFELVEAKAPARLAISQEYPPASIEFLVRDGPGPYSPLIARWAEDAVMDEDVIADVHLRGQVPGGKKEATGTMPRDPRETWPDLIPYADVEAKEPGGELLWSGRFSKAPQSDGDRVSIDGVCVGWQAALADRKGVRAGFVNSKLDRIGDITAQRRKGLLEAGFDPSAISTSVDQFGSGPESNLPAGLSFQGSIFGAGAFELGEMMYDAGGLSIGEVHYDFEGPGTGEGDWLNWADAVFLSVDGVTANAYGPDHNGKTAIHQVITGGQGLRYAVFEAYYTGSGEGEVPQLHRFSHIYFVGTHGLPLQGAWPNMGLTKKQMTSWLIPHEVPALEVTEDSIDDDGMLVADAWYPDAGTAADIVTDLYKPSVLDWFVKTRRLLEVRVPGTYGRRWKATLASSEFAEDGIDTERLWRTLLVSYTDEAGITRYVGPPGSGADLESPLLEITDPDHPAVRAGLAREDVLQLGQSTPQRALEAGVEWLRHANELPRSGKAVLRDFVMDEYGIFRPVGQVSEGDAIQFTDSHDQSYRKIIDYDYGHVERAVPITVDAPDDSVRALLERYGAALIPLGL